MISTLSGFFFKYYQPQGIKFPKLRNIKLGKRQKPLAVENQTNVSRQENQTNVSRQDPLDG